MKRKFDDGPAQSSLVDPSDRANKSRRMELLRIPLDQLGFHPRNRGGLGVLPNHAHEVGWDIVTHNLIVPPSFTGFYVEREY